MSIDPIGPQAPTRPIYPTLAERLTPTDLHRLFSPNYEERRWAPTIARTPSSQVALLVQLKIFQAVGRFLPVEQIPEAAIEYGLSQRFGMAARRPHRRTAGGRHGDAVPIACGDLESTRRVDSRLGNGAIHVNERSGPPMTTIAAARSSPRTAFARWKLSSGHSLARVAPRYPLPDRQMQ